eukprot:TRINITY_DN2607_c1_g1_i1.p1 TRINITY_DN2607_c1_g1~~TRINITY_DN2607_c1_g1_i1.p1  ORF type:complete len:681 (-),score=41.99 TRINITY_DN2607_c1_g1_i1:52-2094(-)
MRSTWVFLLAAFSILLMVGISSALRAGKAEDMELVRDRILLLKRELNYVERRLKELTEERREKTQVASIKRWILLNQHVPKPSAESWVSLYPGYNILIYFNGIDLNHWVYDSELDPRIHFLSIGEQGLLGFRLSKIPNHSPKHIAYLYLIQKGAEFIYETSSLEVQRGSTPHLNFPNPFSSDSFAPILYSVPFSNISTLNPYSLLNHPRTWPRGTPTFDSVASLERSNEFYRSHFPPSSSHNTWVNQGINAFANQFDYDHYPTLNSLAVPIQYNAETPQKPYRFVVPTRTFLPLNNHDTLFSQPAFWSLGFPLRDERYSDVQRGYFLQRIMWECNATVMFSPSNTTIQSSLINKDPQDVYKQIDESVKTLLSWITTHKEGGIEVSELILELSDQYIARKIFTNYEYEYMKTWVEDLRKIGYKFPRTVKKQQEERGEKEGRAALCITGSAERADKGIPGQLKKLEGNTVKYKGRMDVFYYISIFSSSASELEFVKSLPATYGILYQDPVLDPNVTKIPGVQYGLRPRIKPNNLFQQLYALSRCYQMVEEWSNKTGVVYDRFVRMRPDYFLQLGNTLIESTQKGIQIPKGDAWHGVNDRFAIGSMDEMRVYMMRYYDLGTQDPSYKDFHAERFLKYILDKKNVEVRLDNDLGCIELPHPENTQKPSAAPNNTTSSPAGEVRV